MQNQQPTFHPISKALSILEITHDMLESSREQLVNMENIKDKPHILNDELINRSVKLYTSQNEDLDIFLQQCSLWREKELTEVQQYQVTTIEENANNLINIAEGEKAQIVLNSEASLTDQVNRAKGEAEAIIAVAEAIIAVAEATAKGIDVVAKSIQNSGGSDAVSLKVADQYVNAFGKLAKESNTILLPSNLENPTGFIAQAMTIFDNLKSKKLNNSSKKG